MTSPKIKICGITRAEETMFLNEASVDYAGFVFYEKSRRNISFERAGMIKRELAPSIKCVAVTVSPDAKMIAAIEDTGFDIIQIHGTLSDEAVAAASLPLWAAVNEKTTAGAAKRICEIETALSDKAGKIEAYVFDAPSFGSGKRSDWEGGRRPDTKRMFVLAGGLDPENVGEGIRIFDPDVVDVSSSVEGENGKDRDRIQRFVKAVRRGGTL